jgi:hypothetical protein
MTSVSNTRGGSASNWGSGHGNVTIDYPNITVSYNANSGSSTPTATSKKAGTAHTLAAAISRANGVANTNFNITYNANGGTTTPATQTGTKTVTTPYTFNK